MIVLDSNMRLAKVGYDFGSFLYSRWMSCDQSADRSKVNVPLIHYKYCST